MSFIKSFREFMMRVLVEVLIKKRWKIKCGIWAEKDDFSSYSINIDWIWSDGLWIEKINLRLN